MRLRLSAAWFAFLAARQVAQDGLACLAAGFVFGFSSYELAQLTSHINLAFIAAIPARNTPA